MTKKALTFTTAAAALFLMGANHVHAETNTLFVIDSSGSMAGKIDGTTKMNTAKDVLTRLIGDLPHTTNVGVMAYGHRQKASCNDVQLVSPIGSAAGAQAARGSKNRQVNDRNG